MNLLKKKELGRAKTRNYKERPGGFTIQNIESIRLTTFS